MVTHTRLQQYKKRHCTVCITGLFGCRWHRYQQSTYDSNKKDLLWFVFLVLAFAFSVIWFYIWLVGENDQNKVDWFIYGKIGTWFHYFLLVCVLAGITAVYVTLVLVLALCHAGHGFQIYMHWIHKLMLLIIVVCCCITAIAVDKFWHEGWALVRISLHVIGPFLQIGAVIIATALTWIIAAQLYQIQNMSWKVVLFIVYVAAMLFLYLSPLLIHSPCIVVKSQLPLKPQILAHRGASAIAPENTKVAFELAHNYSAYGLESDVLISYDGVPFILHDKTFKRTTNIQDVFPDRVDEPASMFNISDIEMLNAGPWFMEQDPFRTVGSLSAKRRKMYENQRVPKLSELLQWTHDWSKILMIDIKQNYMPEDHPYYNETYNITMETIQNSNIPDQQIWWLYYNNQTRYWGNYTMTAAIKPPLPEAERITRLGIYNLNVGYQTLDQQDIQYYGKANITSNIYVINERWLFSLFWCSGAASITTDQCQVFSDMEVPDLSLPPHIYLIIWIVIDCVSCILVIVIFILQRSRHTIDSFNPESISLQAARQRIIQQGKPNKVMKEKLILPGEKRPSYEQGIVGVTDGQITLERPSSYQNGADVPGSARSSASLQPDNGRGSRPSSNGTGPYSPNVDIDEVKLDMGKINN